MNFYLCLLFEPALQLGQRQVGLLFQPLAGQGLFGGANFGLATRLVGGPSHAPGSRIGRRYLLGPPKTDAELRGQLVERAIALFVGRQKLATIILPVGFSHTFVVAENSPSAVYAIMQNALTIETLRRPDYQIHSRIVEVPYLASEERTLPLPRTRRDFAAAKVNSCAFAVSSNEQSDP